MEAINYNESPLVTEFFHCYSKALPEMCGQDQSVSDPTHAEVIVARKVLELDDTILLVKLEIPGADGSPQFFVTTAPQATLYTPLGMPCVASKHTTLHSFFERFMEG